MPYVSPRLAVAGSTGLFPDSGGLFPDSGALFAAGHQQCDEWRSTALTLRRAATMVDRPATDAAAFDRDDVWQGAVASNFRDELDQWRRRLGGDGVSLAVELVAAADRIEARAVALAGELSEAERSDPGN